MGSRHSNTHRFTLALTVDCNGSILKRVYLISIGKGACPHWPKQSRSRLVLGGSSVLVLCVISRCLFCEPLQDC